MKKTFSMSLTTDYPFPQAPIMSLAWINHCPTSSPSPYRIISSQMCPSSKLNNPSPVTNNDVMNNTESQSPKRRINNRRVSKASYKHIPHKDKPPHLVARRNARERKRVQAVNSAFARLRKCVPIENRNKRLSKVKTLHRAIEYINGLQAMLRQSEDPSKLTNNNIHYSRYSESTTSPDDDELEDEEREIREFNEFDDYLESEAVNKENVTRGWMVSSGCDPNYWTCVPYNEECVGNIPN